MWATVAVDNSDTLFSSACRFLLKPGLFKQFGQQSRVGNIGRKGEFVRLGRKLLRAVGNYSEHSECREGYPVRISLS